MNDKDLNVKVAVLEQAFKSIKESIDNLGERLDRRFLTKDVFDEWKKPIDRIFWGVIWLIISAVVVGLLALVIT